MHPITPEQRKKKPSSPLDNVHSVPYAEYAAKILAGEVAQQGSSTLTDVLKHAEEGMIIAPEGFTEQEAKLQLKQFVGQFSNEQIGLAMIKGYWQVNNFGVEYDEEKLSYSIVHNHLPIESLDLSDLDLTEVYIPPAMSSLKGLDVTGNRLSSLPELPPTLVELFCNHNRLTTLPELPDALARLDCFNNHLVTLPVLPPNLVMLYCYQNQLTLLPVLPLNLKSLHCSDNMLTSLPDIPATVTLGSFARNYLDSQTRLHLKSRGFTV